MVKKLSRRIRNRLHCICAPHRRPGLGRLTQNPPRSMLGVSYLHSQGDGIGSDSATLASDPVRSRWLDQSRTAARHRIPDHLAQLEGLERSRGNCGASCGAVVMRERLSRSERNVVPTYPVANPVRASYNFLRNLRWSRCVDSVRTGGTNHREHREGTEDTESRDCGLWRRPCNAALCTLCALGVLCGSPFRLRTTNRKPLNGHPVM